MAEDLATEASPNIAIKQMNLAYHSADDRLLLKLGLSDQSELQLWLTYRIVRKLWAYLSEDNALPNQATTQAAETPQQAVEQFEEEAKTVETLNQLDFETEYNQTEYQPKTRKVADVESGEEKALSGALLAVEVEKQGQAPEVTMVFTCANGFNLNLNLNAELSLAIVTMLQMATKEAQWPLDAIANIPAPSVVMEETDDENKTLH